MDRLVNMARRKMGAMIVEMVVSEEINNYHSIADLINLLVIGAKPLKEIEPGDHNVKVIQQTVTINQILEFKDGKNKGSRINVNKILDTTILEYSKDIPTEPGYYWMKSTGMGTETIEVVFRPFKDAAFLSIRVETNGHLPTKSVCRCSELDAWWSGPIQKPGE